MLPPLLLLLLLLVHACHSPRTMDECATPSHAIRTIVNYGCFLRLTDRGRQRSPNTDNTTSNIDLMSLNSASTLETKHYNKRTGTNSARQVPNALSMTILRRPASTTTQVQGRMDIPNRYSCTATCASVVGDEKKKKASKVHVFIKHSFNRGTTMSPRGKYPYYSIGTSFRVPSTWDTQ